MPDRVTPKQRRLTKRPRVLVACQRCKTRRQKCDNVSPACSNCSRSNAACTYSDRSAYPLSYVKALEERVQLLEANLRARPHPQHDDGQQPPRPLEGGTRPVGGCSEGSDGVVAASTPIAANTGPDTGDGRRLRPDEPLAEQPGSRLVTGMGLLSSCAAAEPHYFGFSAGLSLAHFVQVAIDFGSNTSSDVSLPLLAERPFSNQALDTSASPAAPPPSPKAGASYIRAYLLLIHPLYPFLNRSLLWRLHKTTLTRSQLPPEEAARPDTPSPQHQMDLALLNLVYAIGARCLQLLGHRKVTKNTPEGHFLRAMQIIGEGLQFTSIRSIELTLLLAIHSMRSPSGTSVWHLSGLAVRQCIELGLHKQRAVDENNARLDQYRKRLFWSTYIFERKTALVLGRPFALSDEEIDLPLPLNIDDNDADDDDNDDADDDRNNDGTRLLSVLHGGDSRVRTSLSFHRAHIELYQLHTQIRLALYQLKRPQIGNRLRDTLAGLFDHLEAWKARVLETFDDDSQDTASGGRIEVRTGNGLGVPEDAGGDGASDSSGDGTRMGPSRSRDVEKTELLLEFYKARRSLLQPLMTEGRGIYPFDANDYVACADSSGQICQLYRRLHRLSPIPFSLRDLHAVFVAGFTLIYSICSCPSIYAPHRASDIGACSTLLYVITEQWASAKKYRDAFEVVAEKMEASIGGFPGQNRAAAAAETTPSLAATGNTFPGSRPGLSPETGMVAAHHGVSPIMTGDEPPPVPAMPHHAGAVVASPMAYGLATATATETVDGFSSYGITTSAANGPAAGIGIDLEADMYGIEGLLSNEGLDWFTEAVL
ncbi:Transcription factor [Niveomyces insectorum RCEF 264]|uniref:Transcription factor n=1 Tax=Niveomyces insectorum RCEF 264 TaxID=1081102 RepID=A0A167SMN5_9HYPO|nr:Transcription factor [Niveomyces insectorum RCEF 264]